MTIKLTLPNLTALKSARVSTKSFDVEDFRRLETIDIIHVEFQLLKGASFQARSSFANYPYLYSFNNVG